VDPVRRCEVRHPESLTFTKAAGRGPLSPPPSTPHVDKPVAAAPDRRGHGVKEKLCTLRDYRHTCGLCIRCDEKRSQDHKCPEAI
jgi:hypothetical protein